jgi:hypothetical protein
MAKQAETASVLVTADNFNRAEADINFGFMVKDGGSGKFNHHREPLRIDYPVVRPNRDTLYSMAVFDLEAGAVTITLPDADKRFMSLQVNDEDHYVPVVAYGAGRHTLSSSTIPIRYCAAGVRILVDPNDPEDVRQVNALQDAVRVEQPGGPGTWDVPNWDMESRKKVRDAPLLLNESLTDTRCMFGARGDVDPVRHLIGTAMGFGGNPEKDALYLPVTPEKNDGHTVYRLTVPGDVPVDGFWSISLYDADGRFEKNDRDAYTLNNITAKTNSDGSATIQFGGCPPSPAGSGAASDQLTNCLPIMKGWNYLVRLYRPRTQVLNGTWKFPDAQPNRG